MLRNASTGAQTSICNFSYGSGILPLGSSYIGALSGVVVGSRGTIAFTNNGGLSWVCTSLAASGGSNSLALNAVIVMYAYNNDADTTVVIAVGQNGTIWRYECICGGGITSVTPAPIGQIISVPGLSTSLYAIDSPDASTIVAVGDGGVVLVSTNTGFTWTFNWAAASAAMPWSTNLPSMPLPNLRSVAFVTATRGFIGGTGGYLATTGTGALGTLWTAVSLPQNGAYQAANGTVVDIAVSQQMGVGPIGQQNTIGWRSLPIYLCAVIQSGQFSTVTCTYDYAISLVSQGGWAGAPGQLAGSIAGYVQNFVGVLIKNLVFADGLGLFASTDASKCDDSACVIRTPCRSRMTSSPCWLD